MCSVNWILHWSFLHVYIYAPDTHACRMTLTIQNIIKDIKYLPFYAARKHHFA